MCASTAFMSVFSVRVLFLPYYLASTSTAHERKISRETHKLAENRHSEMVAGDEMHTTNHRSQTPCPTYTASSSHASSTVCLTTSSSSTSSARCLTPSTEADHNGSRTMTLPFRPMSEGRLPSDVVQAFGICYADDAPLNEKEGKFFQSFLPPEHGHDGKPIFKETGEIPEERENMRPSENSNEGLQKGH